MDDVMEDVSPDFIGDQFEVPDDEGLNDDGMKKAPDGGMRAWLIVLSCFIINLVVQAMTSLIDIISNTDKNITTELKLEQEDVQKASNYFKSLSDLFAPFAVLVLMKFGYKVTVIVGSITVCFAFTNMSMLGGGTERSIGGYWQFWLCGPAAIGINFLKIGALIPILEYFDTKRMKALVLSRLGASLAAFATMGLLFAQGLKWRTVFRINAGLCVLTLATAFTLTDLQIRNTNNVKNEKKPERQSISKRITRIFDVPILKHRTFWIVMVVFFFFKFGLTPVAYTLPLVPQKLLSNNNQQVSASDMIGGVASANAGNLGGQGGAFLFKRLKFMKRFSKQSLMFVLTMVAISGPVIGICSVITPTDSGFYIFFNLVVTIFQALSENMRDESIPSVFGRRNIRLTASFLNMFVGIAGMIAGAIQGAVDKAEKGWKANLKVGGSFLLMVGVATAVLIILHKLGKFKLKEKSGAIHTSKSTEKTINNEPSDEQFPEDINQISVTNTSRTIQNIDVFEQTYRRNDAWRHGSQMEPTGNAFSNGSFVDDRNRKSLSPPDVMRPRHSSMDHLRTNASANERLQQVYGTQNDTTPVSSGMFPEGASYTARSSDRMGRSISDSGFLNIQNNYEQFPDKAYTRSMQFDYPFQGNRQHVQGQMPFHKRGLQEQHNYMRGYYPDHGNPQGYSNHERNSGEQERRKKYGKGKKSQKGKLQSTASPQRNDSNMKSYNYVSEQIADEGIVLY